jgi:hypothetical protein
MNGHIFSSYDYAQTISARTFIHLINVCQEQTNCPNGDILQHTFQNTPWLAAGMNACLTYQAIMQKKAKTYHVKHLKIFSCRDTRYLHARLTREPGKAYRAPDFDPSWPFTGLKKSWK